MLIATRVVLPRWLLPPAVCTAPGHGPGTEAVNASHRGPARTPTARLKVAPRTVAARREAEDVGADVGAMPTPRA